MILDALGNPLPPAEPRPAPDDRPPPFATPLNPADLERELKRLEIVCRQATILLRGNLYQISEILGQLFRLPDPMLARKIQSLPPAIARDVVQAAGRYAAYMSQTLALIGDRSGGVTLAFLEPQQPPPAADQPPPPETPEQPDAGHVPADPVAADGDGFAPAQDAPA